jgi:hypothetical protein
LKGSRDGSWALSSVNKRTARPVRAANALACHAPCGVRVAPHGAPLAHTLHGEAEAEAEAEQREGAGLSDVVRRNKASMTARKIHFL